MDPKDHKRLADNAYIKAEEMLQNKEYTIDLLDFAHGARLHYMFSTFDKENQDYIKNKQKSEKLLKEIYSRIKIEDIVNTL